MGRTYQSMQLVRTTEVWVSWGRDGDVVVSW